MSENKNTNNISSLTTKCNSGTVNQAKYWNGITDDHGTENSTDTWIPVFNNMKLQHTLPNYIANLVSRNKISISWNYTYVENTGEFHAYTYGKLLFITYWIGVKNITSTWKDYHICTLSGVTPIVTTTSICMSQSNGLAHNMLLIGSQLRLQIKNETLDPSDWIWGNLVALIN